ncbi:MAG: hypothetical protein LBR81_05725 [Prevotellaceae bacterium]|nr:hypothetical protein [Prevotellaceae bacterium]
MKKITFFLLLSILLSTAVYVPDLIPYLKGNLWGYRDESKNITIPIDKTGQEIIPCMYYSVRVYRSCPTLGRK